MIVIQGGVGCILSCPGIPHHRSTSMLWQNLNMLCQGTSSGQLLQSLYEFCRGYLNVVADSDMKVHLFAKQTADCWPEENIHQV